MGKRRTRSLEDLLWTCRTQSMSHHNKVPRKSRHTPKTLKNKTAVNRVLEEWVQRTAVTEKPETCDVECKNSVFR